MEDRLSKLEKTVRDFNLVVSGIEVQGGFSELKPKSSIEERVAHLEKLHDNFEIRGGANCTVEGSLRTGYAICAVCPSDADSSNNGIPIGAPPAIGACCVDGDCSIQTPAGCAGLGGDYQGDGTDCDPNPCPATGACCHDEVCTIETQADCEGTAGTYQGDDTTCDPNPCELPTCDCGGFFNPDDGLYYNTKNYENTVDNSLCPESDTCICDESPPPGYPCGSNRWQFYGTYSTPILIEETYDPDTCELTQTFDNFNLGYYCCCFVSCDVPGICNPYPPGLCPPCEGAVIPEIWTQCAVVDTVITYSDPCTP